MSSRSVGIKGMGSIALQAAMVLSLARRGEAVKGGDAGR